MKFPRHIRWWLIGSTVALALAGCQGRDQTAPPTTAATGDLPVYAMVRIAPGSFMMGSPGAELGRDEDERLHRVTITRAFDLGKNEVTQALWKTVMGSNPSAFGACGTDCPVENISWLDAVEFCNRLSQRAGLTACYSGEGDGLRYDPACTGYRLPSEAEWEYAARAGASTAVFGGELTVTDCRLDPALDAVGWYCGNSAVTYAPCLSAADGGGAACSGTHAVGRKKPNAWGLHDMHGNATEWVWDRFGPYPDEAVSDPLGPPTGQQRVLRGGGWRALAQHCRAANRRVNKPDYHMSVLGVRLARNAP